uniref:Uncharacterized protein n=1 Tax=Ananas comosus var. bracteatus TaxID=296719 RepID=A0A6V7NI19_ANACO|nr:unnamed protein product [Ananas comosus var. bracteatus]
MDRFRPHKSPGSERFIGVLSSSSSSSSDADADAAEEGFELHEDELFASAPAPPSPLPGLLIPRPSFSVTLTLTLAPSPLPPPRLPPPHGWHSRRPPEDFTRFSPSTAPPPEPPCYARARTFRPHPLPPPPPPHLLRLLLRLPDDPLDSSAEARVHPLCPGGRIHHQSAPVNVPLVNRRPASGPEELEGEDDGEDEMLPPHEIVARAHTKESPLRASSMLEGAGRTLKGRDQRQVRDAIWSKMGFMD